MGQLLIVNLLTQWCIPFPRATHISLKLEQQIANQLGGNILGRAAEEGLGEVLGGRGGFRSGSIKSAKEC
jgi:hypothetical protein